jgi:hypothetical protein
MECNCDVRKHTGSRGGRTASPPDEATGLNRRPGATARRAQQERRSTPALDHLPPASRAARRAIAVVIAMHGKRAAASERSRARWPHAKAGRFTVGRASASRVLDALLLRIPDTAASTAHSRA